MTINPSKQGSATTPNPIMEMYKEHAIRIGKEPHQPQEPLERDPIPEPDQETEDEREQLFMSQKEYGDTDSLLDNLAQPR